MSDIYGEMLDRLFVKYRHSPTIISILEILATPIQDTHDALDYFLAHLSIDDAEGPLIDAIGGWIGVDRPAAQEEDIFCLCCDEDVADDPDNHHGLATDALTEGGYLTGDDGCLSKSSPGSYASDPVYREYIKAKASTFRQKATRDVLYTYLSRFGIRAKFTEGQRTVEIEPSSYDDLDYAVRYYIINHGYRPAGITYSIKPKTEPEEI